MNQSNRYEGLFILNTVGKDEGVPEILEYVESEIKAVGGTVDSIQKMDRRPFARPSRKMSSGFYANVIFKGPSDIVKRLNTKFALDERIFRVIFLQRDEPKAQTKSQQREPVKPRG